MSFTLPGFTSKADMAHRPALLTLLSTRIRWKKCVGLLYIG